MGGAVVGGRGRVILLAIASPGRLRQLVLPVLAGLAAAVVLGHGLGRLPLWRDEVASVDIAARPVPAILAAAGRIDVVHTAYYLLLHGVLRWGDGEVLVRLPSLLAAVATVALVVGLALRRLGPAPAVVAGAVLIGNPWLSSYAREARPYALATALVCAAAVALLGGPPSSRRVITFTALAVAATWVHLFDALPLAGLAIGSLLPRLARRVPGGPGPERGGVPSLTRTWLGCAVAAAAAVAPLVVLAAREARQVSWVTKPTVDDVRSLLVDAAGSRAAETTVAVVLVAGIVCGAVAGRGAGGGRTSARAASWAGSGRAPSEPRPSPPGPTRPAPSGPALLVPALLGAALGPLVLFGISSWGTPLYVERYVLASAPLVALAAAAAVALLPGAARAGRAGVRVLVAAVVVAVAATGVPAAAAGPADKTEDLRAGAAFLAAHTRAGDCVAYAPGWARVGVAFYGQRVPAQPIPARLLDVALDPGRPVVGLFPDEFPLGRVEADLLACRRVWVVGYPGAVGLWRPVPEVTTAALADVAPDFTPAAPTTFGDLTVALWTARAGGGA